MIWPIFKIIVGLVAIFFLISAPLVAMPLAQIAFSICAGATIGSAIAELMY